MKRTVLIALVVVAIVGGMMASMFMMGKSYKQSQEEVTKNTEIANSIEEDSAKKENTISTEKVEEANSEDVEKLSPNAIIELQKFYEGCQHTVSRYEEAPNDLVNATREDVQKKYDSWQLREFSKDKVVFYKEVEGECGEHYMLRDLDGRINIYKLDENGNEALIEETDIATEYLTETDMIDMENGLIVYGKENLNKLLEDFE